MDIIKCEKQLKSLITHYYNGGLDFNYDDIKTIECVINELKKKQDVIDKAIKFIEKELGNISEVTNEFTAYGDLDYAQNEVEELYRILKEVE